MKTALLPVRPGAAVDLVDPNRESDDALVARARGRGGDAGRAFAQLVERHGPRVRRRAAAILGNAADADDLAQEVFLRVFRALPSYEARGRFDHWLERIVTNSCRMHLRSRVRYERRLIAIESASRGQAQQPIAESRTDAVQSLARIVDHTDRALWMRAAEGLPYSRIATQLGISESAAKMRVKRCRDGLARRLEDGGAGITA